MTYYRISRTEMTDADMHEGHVSYQWGGGEDEPFAGLSVCDSYQGLVEYFAGGIGVSAGRGADLVDVYLVELEGEDIGPGWEGGDIERMIHPARIISQHPVAVSMFAEDVIAEIHDGFGGDNSDMRASMGTRGHIVLHIVSECTACEAGIDEDGDECCMCDGSGEIAELASEP